MVNDIAVQEFVKAIKETPQDTNRTYNATVSHVDDEGVVWVNIHGSEKETPTASTSTEVQRGDAVTVQWRNNKLYIGGNYSNPSAGIVRVASVEQNAEDARLAAEAAEYNARLAQRLAEQNAITMANTVIEINNDIADLQNQIDGNITTWFYDYQPTTSNAPASTWTTVDEKNNHLGDLFYDTSTGYAYRWMSDGASTPTFSWSKITDTDVTTALATALAAQDTADHKRRVFITTPTVPYDVGDLWCEGTTGDILTCTHARTEAQSYTSSDWAKLNKYTDDTRADEAYSLANTAKVSADGKNKIYRQATQPSDGTYVVGDIWFDTSHSNKIYRYSGSAWVAVTLGDDALDSLSASKLTAGTIDASVITVSNLDAGNITTGNLSADRMKVNSIAAINSLTTGKINAARLDVGSITVGSLADGSSYSTTTQMTDAIDDAVDDIEVGGRNYLVAIDASLRSIGVNNVTHTYDNGTYVLTCSVAGGGSNISQIYTQNIPCADLAGKSVLFHADSITASNSSAVEKVRVTFKNANNTGLGNHDLDASTLSKAITVPATAAYYQLILRMDESKNAAVGDTLTVVGAKLEIGNKPTDWSPAPEDVDADIAEASKTATSYITAIDNNGIRVHAANNPTTNYAKIDADGMEVYKGGNKVAKFGQTIELSDGTRTLYEVKPLSGAAKVTRLYNLVYYDGYKEAEPFTEIVHLGRTVSSWSSIVLTYDINSTVYTKTYSSFPISDESEKFTLDISYADSSNARLNIGINLNSDDNHKLLTSETLTIVSLVFTYNTSQTAIESTLGAYADKTQSAAFRVGNGISTNAESNSFSLDWAGNGYFNGDVYANCDANSSGGVSLGTVQYIPSAFNADTPEYHMDIGVFRIGMVVMLDISFFRNKSIAAGGNVFNLDISRSEIPMPQTGVATGMAFYNNSTSSRALGIVLGDTDGTGPRIRVYNNGTNAVTITSTQEVRCTMTYICDTFTAAHWDEV